MHGQVASFFLERLLIPSCQHCAALMHGCCIDPHPCVQIGDLQPADFHSPTDIQARMLQLQGSFGVLQHCMVCSCLGLFSFLKVLTDSTMCMSGFNAVTAG